MADALWWGVAGIWLLCIIQVISFLDRIGARERMTELIESFTQLILQKNEEKAKAP